MFVEKRVDINHGVDGYDQFLKIGSVVFPLALSRYRYNTDNEMHTRISRVQTVCHKICRDSIWRTVKYYHAVPFLFHLGSNSSIGLPATYINRVSYYLWYKPYTYLLNDFLKIRYCRTMSFKYGGKIWRYYLRDSHKEIRAELNANTNKIKGVTY